MEPVTNAAFSLENYRISRFLLNAPDVEPKGLKIRFNPSGIYNQKLGVYILLFDFKAFQPESGLEQNDNIFEATMVSTFKFEEPVPFDKLPDFFYINSLAIVFPHLRAFVSTVTSLANTRRIILPLLNLTTLETTLKENTSLSND